MGDMWTLIQVIITLFIQNYKYPISSNYIKLASPNISSQLFPSNLHKFNIIWLILHLQFSRSLAPWRRSCGRTHSSSSGSWQGTAGKNGATHRDVLLRMSWTGIAWCCLESLDHGMSRVSLKHLTLLFLFIIYSDQTYLRLGLCKSVVPQSPILPFIMSPHGHKFKTIGPNSPFLAPMSLLRWRAACNDWKWSQTPLSQAPGPKFNWQLEIISVV
jgi:hypothetical protein